LSQKNNAGSWPVSDNLAKKMISFARDNEGLCLWANQGHLDSINGDLLVLAPPLITQKSQLKELFDRLESLFFNFSF